MHNIWTPLHYMITFSGMAGSRSNFGSCRFIRFFAVVIKLDGSWRARHLLENGGEGDHLGDLPGIAEDLVQDLLSAFLVHRAVLFFKRKAGRDAPSLRLWVMCHHQAQGCICASACAGAKPFIK